MMRCSRSFAGVLMAAVTKASLSVPSATRDGMGVCATSQTPKSKKTSVKSLRLSRRKKRMIRSSIQSRDQTSVDKIQMWVAERVRRGMVTLMSSSQGRPTLIQQKSTMQMIMKRSRMKI